MTRTASPPWPPGGLGWSYADLLVNVLRQARGGEAPGGKNQGGGDRAAGG